MNIHWLDLVKVAVVSLLFGVGVVTVFTVGLLGLSRAESDGSGVAVGRSVAGVCFALCGAAVLFGLWLIVPQFH